LSWFGYAHEILMVNQWKGVKDISCPSNTTFCFKEGEEIIKYLEVDQVSFMSLWQLPLIKKSY